MINGKTLESISHDLRNSLNAIVGFTGTLLMQLPGPINAGQEEQLRLIQISARQLLSEINGLLDAAGNVLNTATPLEPAPVFENGPEPEGGKNNTRARILFIDDDPKSRKLMAYFLKAFGHEVLIAEDGNQGLEIARLALPDLILCDVQMPECSGYQVARELKSDPVLSRIPLVAVTGMALLDHRDNSSAGAFDYSILKPIHPERLAGQLESFLTLGAIHRQSSEIISGTTHQGP